MAQFLGQLKTNKIFATNFNQVISHQVFGTGINDLTGVYATRRVDGTLYGDTKLYTSTDVLKSYGLSSFIFSNSLYDVISI